MKSRQEVISALSMALYMSEGDYVTISRFDAKWLLNYLEAPNRTATPIQQQENCQLFYCDRCGKSFWFPGREDAEIRKNFGYSVWYATCPTCGDEIRLTDHYWR